MTWNIFKCSFCKNVYPMTFKVDESKVFNFLDIVYPKRVENHNETYLVLEALPLKESKYYCFYILEFD